MLPSGSSQRPTEKSEGLQRAEEAGDAITFIKMAEEKKAKETEETKKADEKPVLDKEEKKEAKLEPKPEAKEEKKEEKPKEETKKEKKKDKKKEEKVDIVSENVYTIPLGKVHQTKPCYKKANKAVAFVLKYLKRHTKSENIKISSELNAQIWARGACKPPRRVQIKAIVDSEGKVTAAPLK